MTYFYNPVKVFMGSGSIHKLPDILGNRKCIIISTVGMKNRGTIDKIKNLCGDKITTIYLDVLPNPTIASVTKASEIINAINTDVLVAIGGGSVIDTAKAVAAIHHPGLQKDWLSLHLKEGNLFPEEFSPLPLIAIPTTAGTGSEVTMWATIWDEATGQKYSLAHIALYPEVTIVDPELTLTLPEEITVTTALDALSHAMEAIWNKNANPISDTLASQAISVIPENLKTVMLNPYNKETRAELHYASLKAGLAFSNTRTAIAHSISYPLTGIFGIPHGIAASITLAEIIKVNGKDFPDRIDIIVKALGCSSIEDASATMNTLVLNVGINKLLNKYMDKKKFNEVEVDYITPGRADNNLVTITNTMAQKILSSAIGSIFN
ncbi:MAG: phosphonoacetaldehyde reductase [Syntrophomonadaceae bacterium]|nr:phosphonoacetaldehyde reductase [Syntrophomonadaceae bacterium]